MKKGFLRYRDTANQESQNQFSAVFETHTTDTHFPERWEANNDQVGVDYIRRAFVELSKSDLTCRVDPRNPNRYRVEAFKTVDEIRIRFVWFA